MKEEKIEIPVKSDFEKSCLTSVHSLNHGNCQFSELFNLGIVNGKEERTVSLELERQLLRTSIPVHVCTYIGSKLYIRYQVTTANLIC